MEKEEEDKATTIESLERDVEVRVLSLVFSSSFFSSGAVASFEAQIGWDTDCIHASSLSLCVHIKTTTDARDRARADSRTVVDKCHARGDVGSSAMPRVLRGR